MLFPIKTIGNNKYISLEEFWEDHKRGTNYISHIKGKDKKYKYKRDFLDVNKISGEHYYNLDNFIVNNCYQFVFTYNTGGGKETEYLKGFFQVSFVEKNGALHLEKITEEELLEEINRKNNK